MIYIRCQLIEYIRSVRSYLAHHASPRDNISIDPLPLFLFVVHNSGKETIQVLIGRVILLLEGFETL